MERHYRYDYEVRFKNGSYEFITGNSEFYKLLKEDFFITFDSLLTDCSKGILEKATKQHNCNQPFGLEMLLHNKESRFMLAVITEDSNSECTVLRMAELEKFFNDYRALLSERQENLALLSQLDCICYSYDAKQSLVACYHYHDGKRVISSTELRQWEKESIESLPEQAHDSVTKFISNLKNGIRTFIGVIPAGKDGDSIDYSGTAIYDGDVHVKTVGIIGKTSRRTIVDTVRHDQLTGLYLKEDITNYAKMLIDDLKQKTAVAIIDIDDFKNVNDHFGHSVGDMVLRKCAAVIDEELGDSGKAGRIGGDEFFIVIDNFDGMEAIKSILRAIKYNIAEAYSDKKDGFHVTTSIGLTVAPDNADNFGTLYNLADHMLYLAKNKGKNRYIFYEEAKHGSVADILQTGVDKIGIISRRGISRSETVCRILDLMYLGKTFSPDDILDSIVKHFGVERILLFNRSDKTIVAQGGSILPEDGDFDKKIDYVYDERLDRYFNNNVMVINNIKTFSTLNPDIYENLFNQGIRSIMQHRFVGKNGKNYVISYESITNNDTWHIEDMYLYRMLDHILVECL